MEEALRRENEWAESGSHRCPPAVTLAGECQPAARSRAGLALNNNNKNNRE